MANTTIQLKKSATPSASPSNLANGELAINYADGKLFYKAANGTILAITSGSSSNSFSTVNANGTLVVADSPTGILTIAPGNNITVVGDAVNDKVTFGLADVVTINGILSASELTSSLSNGDDGGQINLNKPQTSTTITDGVTIDVFQNKIRFFESGGTSRGAFIDLTSASTNVGSNLLSVSGSTVDTVARANVNYVNTAMQAAFAQANVATANVNYVNTAMQAAFSVANAAVTATTLSGANSVIGTAANNYAVSIGTASNTYFLTTLAGANSAVGTGANTVGSAAFAAANIAIANVNFVNTAMQAAFAKANTGGGGASVAISDSAPSSPTANSLWWSSDLGKMFIYYNDGSSFQWVETSPSPDVSGISTALTIAINSYTNSNLAINVAVNSLNVSNSIGIIANSTNSAVANAYNQANSAYNVANAGITTIVSITTGTNDQYIILSGNTSGNLTTANIETDLKWNPATNLFVANGTIRDTKGDVRDIPVNNQTIGYGLTISDTGKTIATNTTIYVPNAVFFAGNTVSVYNNSSASITVTSNSGIIMYLGGTATTGNRTLAQRGLATIYCVAANTFVVGGAGVT